MHEEEFSTIDEGSQDKDIGKSKPELCCHWISKNCPPPQMWLEYVLESEDLLSIPHVIACLTPPNASHDIHAPYTYSPSQVTSYVNIHAHISNNRLHLIFRTRISIQLLQNTLIQEKHASTLHTRPHQPRPNTSKPTRDPLGPVDEFQTSDNGRSV